MRKLATIYLVLAGAMILILIGMAGIKITAGDNVVPVRKHERQGPSGKELVLPPLPDDVDKILSINNDARIGICVGYINQAGEPVMIQYGYNEDGSYSLEYVFKFERR